MRALTVPAVLLVSLLAPAAAHGATVPGMGDSFATAPLFCNNSPSKPPPSDPVVGEHRDAMVRVTLDDLPDRDFFWSVDLPADPFVRDVVEFGGADGDRWWWPGGTVHAGATLAVPVECVGDDPQATGKAEWFDRPTTPFEFSDPTVVHQTQSILGFRVPDAGRYVADVTVTDAQLQVFNPDFEIGDEATNANGTWDVTYRAPGSGRPLKATLLLGRLDAGIHDIPFEFVDLSGEDTQDFSLNIHLADPKPSSPGVVAPGATPTETRVVVSGEQTGRPTARLTVRSARTFVHAALRRQLGRWRVTRIDCALRSDRKAACRFDARLGRRVLHGRGTLTLDATGRAQYRITARVTRRA